MTKAQPERMPKTQLNHAKSRAEKASKNGQSRSLPVRARPNRKQDETVPDAARTSLRAGPARSSLAAQRRPLCDLGLGDHAAADAGGRGGGALPGFSHALSHAAV